ncbi:hypothetical protein F511_38209 [Dorcoceras hygrometricum]|uniref:Uncharacterized protein n=1 Tax=Dorcoceras hygrometricum TaxID=472368 RepID=A0A2Z7A2Y3_9LAMI|nr:hypothetical protein F511_38209 [Dorcoceras hygrometricum]
MLLQKLIETQHVNCAISAPLVEVYWTAGQVRLPAVSWFSNLLDLRCVCRVFNRLLPESSGFLAGLVVAQYKDVRASGNTALSSPCWDRSHHEPSG